MARKYYSRRIQTERKRNQRRGIFLIIITIIILVVFFFYGLPTIIKLASFIADFRSSSSPIGLADSTPPAPPSLDQLPDSTKDSSIDINGTSEAGSTVVLFLGNDIEETLTNANGRFSFTYFLDDGENIISSYAKDSSGNQSGKSRTYVVTYDNSAPDLSITKPINGEKVYGNDGKITIEGQTEQRASVTINGGFVVVGGEGHFSKILNLNEGVNEIAVKSEDEANNATEIVLSVEYFK
ncbi:hypothetical protein ACFL2C_00395 [Patescibacteria group bacterium]